MQFVRLTREVLKQLKAKGYNVLTAVEYVEGDGDPSWMPDTVDNLFGFIHEMADEKPFLMIENAIQFLADDEIRGQVFIF